MTGCLLILTYGPHLPNINSIINKRLVALHRSDRMKIVFDAKTLVGFRRDANLQDMLVHKKHRNILESEVKGTSTCGKNCVMCKFMSCSITHLSIDHKVYSFTDHINCKSSNVIYGIHRNVCKNTLYM